MATTIPIHQAIKFYPEADDVFNLYNPNCACNLPDQWEYIIKPGDVTEVQIARDCIPITYGSDIILNGSFENGTGADPDDWTINNTEKIERANDDPYVGQWALRWNNPVGESFATQDTGVNFLDGEVWLLEFYVKVTDPAVVYLTPLEIFIGGLPYLVTPTEEYTKITVPIVFLDNGIDQDVIFYHNSILPAADFMYVDLVILRKITYSDNTCEFNLVYNGEFEYGQHKVTGDTPVIASFDGWELDGTVEASITGGFNGTRCPVLYGSGTPASIGQTLAVMTTGNTYLIRFMAKAATEGDTVTVTAGVVELDVFALTSEWTEYTLEYTPPSDATELTFTASTNEIYIDDVSIALINPVNNDSVYVHDTVNDVYYTNDILTEEFEGGYNALFDWEEMIQSDEPGCLQIITEFADENLISNSKFENGVGNLFTGWTLIPGDGSITQTTTGGLSGSRGIVLTRVTNNVLIVQAVLSPNTSYKISLWAKRLAGTGQIRINSDMTIFAIIEPTTEFKRYEFEVTTGGVDNDFAIINLSNGLSVVIDNVFVSINGEGIHYSELFTYDKTNGICAPEIAWYDTLNCFGINYESGFKNKMRVEKLNFATLFYPTEMTKTLNGLESSISRAEIKKQKTLNVTPVPEFIHDRLAVAIRHSNIEVGSEALCSVEETVYTPVDSETGSRLSAATIILGIEGEILAERSINCEE